VIGQRIRIQQAAAIKSLLAADFGTTLKIDGRPVTAFPAPAVLAELDACPGLNDVKITRLRGIAQAALDGQLDAARLRALPRSRALDELLTIPGIGPFSAELILLRGAGDPDHTPTAEPRLARALGRAYDLPTTPSGTVLAHLSQAWRPYRTWVSLLLRTMLEDDTHEIAGAGEGRRRPAGQPMNPANFTYDQPATPTSPGTSSPTTPRNAAGQR
jgi:DNA-3-methyladenine glycosylase II